MDTSSCGLFNKRSLRGWDATCFFLRLHSNIFVHLNVLLFQHLTVENPVSSLIGGKKNINNEKRVDILQNAAYDILVLSCSLFSIANHPAEILQAVGEMTSKCKLLHNLLNLDDHVSIQPKRLSVS